MNNKNISLIKFFALACSFIFMGKMNAQDKMLPLKDSLKNSFHAGFFAAQPIGLFQSTDLNNASAGYAQTGFGAEVGYTYRIKNGFCVNGNLSFAKNGIDNTKLASQIKDLTEKQTGFSNLQSGATESSWKNFSLAAGAGYQYWFGSNKKMCIEPQIFFGAAYVVTPLVTYNVRVNDLTFETRNLSKGNFAFSHRETVKFNYLLGSRTLLFFNLSYYGAMANATGMEHIVVGNGTFSKTTNDYKINVSAILAGIGISTRF